LPIDSAGRKRVLTLLPILLAFCGMAAEDTSADRLVLNSQISLQARHGKNLELLVQLQTPGEWESLASRFAGGAANAGALAERNGNATRPRNEITVPFELLGDNWRELVLRTVFPADTRDAEGWHHVVRSSQLPLYDAGLWQIAEWFCGDGRAFRKLAAINRLNSPEPSPGSVLHIPTAELHHALQARAGTEDGLLEYGEDRDGPYAVYRLQKGEALYSAVVLRFTGRQTAEDVVQLAERIAARSHIPDHSDIPVGFPVRIPFEFLEPRFLPSDHPRRKEAEAEAAAVAEALAAAPLAGTRNGLEGVWIILDPGHGGEDLGTMANGLWEHDYVYDVTCRLKTMLERETNAHVEMTLIDSATGCKPSSGDKLKKNRGGDLQTTPPFHQEKGQTKLGVNLRWYIANARYREALAKGIKPERVIFLSIHADSRSPSLGGMMAYVPGARYRKGRAQPNGKAYRRYAEVREQPNVTIKRKRALRSEAVSKKLAEVFVSTFKKRGLPVPDASRQPIRNRIIRGRSVYVPAVLRWNEVPTKLLVEVVNLNNRTDARLLARAGQRDRMASALLEGVYRHFGEKPPKNSSAP
jgi:N-acetylmuramoyl-L-alanine amidase